MKKRAGELATKWDMPEEGYLYDLIKGRVAAARESGDGNTSRNLLRLATDVEDGPMLPRAIERFFREMSDRLGFAYTKRMVPIVAARRDP